MNNCAKILLRFFSITSVLYCINVTECNGGIWDYSGEETDTGIEKCKVTPNDDILCERKTGFEIFQDIAGEVSGEEFNLKKKLCPTGQYVYKCGNYRIGFDWLKGMFITKTTVEDVEIVLDTNENNNENNETTIIEGQKQACYAKNTTDSQNNEDGPIIAYNWVNNSKCIKITVNKVKTNNYYTTDNQSDLLQQMRDFFAAKKNTSINYCEKVDQDNNKCTKINTINVEDYKSDRDTILNTVCNPFDSEMVITCATCPGSAKVGASTVEINTALKTTKSWTFHTIADCYMQDFTDSTGTFKYVKPEQITNPNLPGEECYYSNTDKENFDALQGDSIENFNTKDDNIENTTTSSSNT